jgi:chromosome segregation ATPase
MIELIMYFGIGFLVAALFALLFVPLVHNRAVRLTMRRLEAATPLTIAEIRADKDQLRAEFAMSTRRLEMSVEQMKTKTTTQLADLGKKTDAINQLKRELGEKTAAIFALEARDKALTEQMRATEEEYELKNSALREAERTLADKEADLAKLVAELGEQSINSDAQRIELASLRAQVEALKVTVTDYERTARATEERLIRERGDAQTAATDLTHARSKLGGLESRTAELESQLVMQANEAEYLDKRVRELEARLGDQGRMLAERDYEIERLRSENESARQIERDLRGELSSAGGRGNGASERYKSEIAQLEAQLANAIDERTRLQAEIATIKRETESSWAAERVENALLRERINDVAAEVARLTAVLEGPGSPIDTLLSGFPHGAGSANGNGARGEAGPARLESEQDQRSTLADRIRALQSTASRVASTN